jgi:hypothetical protein
VFVAAVMAVNEDAAKGVITEAYDEATPLEWSFVTPLGDDGPFSERFPRADWMKWPYPELVERTAYGAPLDAEEAALLAALRARGLNELAEMALHCFGESYGHAPTALRELQAPPLAARHRALTVERIALLRLHQRNMALDEPDPMVPVTSADLLALLDAAERSVRVVRALREKADWQQQHGDDPRDLRNFADSIDPHAEEYDPNHDPLVPR